MEVESATAFDLVDEQGKIIPYQKQGLGSQELIHLEMTPKELQGLYTNIHDGRVMGMSILGLRLERMEDTVLLEATVSERRQPDPEIWRRGVIEIENAIADPSVKSFRVRARSLDTNKITFTASDVPGLGWKTLFIQPRQAEAEAPAQIPPLAAPLPAAGKTSLFPEARLPPQEIPVAI